jgi:hypothetical protein
MQTRNPQLSLERTAVDGLLLPSLTVASPFGVWRRAGQRNAIYCTSMQAESTPIVLQPTRRIAIWLAASISLSLTASAQGQAISITNAGFESDVLNCPAGPQCFDLSVIPGWTLTGQLATQKPSTGPGVSFPAGYRAGQMSRRLATPSAPESSPRIWVLRPRPIPRTP